jgi:hypothetical protein
MVKIALTAPRLFPLLLAAILPVSLGAQAPGGTRGGGHQGGGKHGAAQPVPDSTGIIPRPATRNGCGSFDVRVGEGGSVSIARTGDPPCGPIQPTIVGSPTFDPSDRLVRVPFALENSGLVRLHAPALLIADVGSLIPVGRRLSAATLHFVDPESTAPDSITRRGPESFWRFDNLLRTPGAPPVTGEDGAIVLSAGKTSMPRTVAIQVAPGIAAFRLTLTAIGTYVFTVPAQPPTRVRNDELEDSRAPGNSVTGDPHFPGRVVRNKLWLMFRQGATADEREAAIEQVDGVVVGGTTRGKGDRYYYVRIAANPDSGGVPLERAIRALAALPQVQDVFPDQLSVPGAMAAPP